MESYKKYKRNADFIRSVRTNEAEIIREITLLKKASLPIGYVTDGFFIKQEEMMVKVAYSEIVWVEAGGNYSHIHLKGNSHISVVHNLGRLEDMLPKRYFTRINKSEIVNLHLVDRFCGNMLYINRRTHTIAPAYREYVFSCFNILIRKK